MFSMGWNCPQEENVPLCAHFTHICAWKGSMSASSYERSFLFCSLLSLLGVFFFVCLFLSCDAKASSLRLALILTPRLSHQSPSDQTPCSCVKCNSPTCARTLAHAGAQLGKRCHLSSKVFSFLFLSLSLSLSAPSPSSSPRGVLSDVSASFCSASVPSRTLFFSPSLFFPP